ncbi:MAG: lipoprotein [Merdibacter sp.]
MKKLILILTAVLMLAGCATQTPQATPTPETTPEATTTPESTAKTDSFTGPTVDSVTSASIAQEARSIIRQPASLT